VSSQEGTTRDTIEEVVNLRGIPLRLIDTAGVRESNDEIEQEGIAMTHGQVARADLVLVIRDLSEPFSESVEMKVPEGARSLQILNKSDREDPSWGLVEGLRVSCESGFGFEDLERAIAELLSLDEAHWGDHSVAVNSRHQSCLTRARASLSRAIASLRAGDEPEFTALDLRESLTAVGEIAGVVDTEEILGEIFGNFCIGK
jgi:tRNA modification GTPase